MNPIFRIKEVGKERQETIRPYRRFFSNLFHQIIGVNPHVFCNDFFTITKGIPKPPHGESDKDGVCFKHPEAGDHMRGHPHSAQGIYDRPITQKCLLPMGSSKHR